MDLNNLDLKKIFPISYEKPTETAIVIYVVAVVIASLVIGLAGALTGWIPLIGKVIGIFLRIAGTLVDIYAVAGIAVKLLLHFNKLNK